MFTTEAEGMPSLFSVGTLGGYRKLRWMLVSSLLPLDRSIEVAGELQYTVEARVDGVWVCLVRRRSELGTKQWCCNAKRLCRELGLNSFL